MPSLAQLYQPDSTVTYYPVNTRHWPNVVLMLTRRLRRRPNIKTTLGQCLVLAGYDPMVFKCWPDVGPTLKQHCVNVSCLLGTAPGINSRPNTATLTKCWASVVDGVPALKQRWLNVIVQRCACLLGQSVPEAYTLQQHLADTRRR